MLFMLLGQLVLFWIEGKTSVWIGNIQNTCIHLYQRWSRCYFCGCCYLMSGKSSVSNGYASSVFRWSCRTAPNREDLWKFLQGLVRKKSTDMLWNICIRSKQIQGLVRKQSTDMLWSIHIGSKQIQGLVTPFQRTGREKSHWFILKINPRDHLGNPL